MKKKLIAHNIYVCISRIFSRTLYSRSNTIMAFCKWKNIYFYVNLLWFFHKYIDLSYLWWIQVSIIRKFIIYDFLFDRRHWVLSYMNMSFFRMPRIYIYSFDNISKCLTTKKNYRYRLNIPTCKYKNETLTEKNIWIWWKYSDRRPLCLVHRPHIV